MWDLIVRFWGRIQTSWKPVPMHQQFDRLVHRAHTAVPIERADAIRVLAQWEDEQREVTQWEDWYGITPQGERLPIIPILLAALHDPDPQVRQTVADELAWVGRDDLDTQDIIEALFVASAKEMDGMTRVAMKLALAELGDSRALVGVFDDIAAMYGNTFPTRERLNQIAVALVRAGAFLPLLAGLKHTNPIVRCITILALSHLPERPIREPIRRAMRDEHHHVRAVAAEVLARIPEPDRRW